MLLKDIRREFYDNLSGKRVLLLIHHDVDSICASKILFHLFKADHILYTAVSIKTKQDLKISYEKFSHNKFIKNVILLNCGGCIDLVDYLQPNDDTIFYVADNHRPLDVCNIYNDNQIRIISTIESDEKVPAFDDIFKDDDDDEEELDEEGNPIIDEESLEKKRLRRLWDQRRQDLLFDYAQFSYFGSSTAVLLYELAWKLSKDNNDTLWWAIVGQTELMITEKMDQDKYLLAAASLQDHVSRLNHQAQNKQCNKLTFEKELRLVLYRHWTLVESMNHSPYFSSTLKLWTIKGQKRMFELLAEVGLPLSECNQMYSSMDMAFRNELHSSLESKIEKYNLEKLSFASFTFQPEFKSRITALDFVFATLALLEPSDKNKDSSVCFLEASDCLNLSKIEVLERGIELSKLQLKAVFSQVTVFLSMNQIISAGPFLYATVSSGSAGVDYFSSPYCLTLLAQFTLKSHVSSSKFKKAKTLPLLLTTPFISEETEEGDEDEKCLVCGIPPAIESSGKNLFGKAFEQAAVDSGCHFEANLFESFIIKLKVKERNKFLDTLMALMA